MVSLLDVIDVAAVASLSLSLCWKAGRVARVAPPTFERGSGIEESSSRGCLG